MDKYGNKSGDPAYGSGLSAEEFAAECEEALTRAPDPDDLGMYELYHGPQLSRR